MKLKKILSMSVLAGAVLISASGCSTASKNTGENSIPTPTVSQGASDHDRSANSAVDGVLLTVNGYYDFISQPDSSDKLSAAEASITERPASDATIKKFAEDFPEGFKYFDTSSSKKINSAYQAMMGGTSAGKFTSGLKMSVPAEAVTVSNDTAEVNTTYLEVTIDGDKKPVAPETSPSAKDIVNLVKNESGTWVIVAKDSSVDPTSP